MTAVLAVALALWVLGLLLLWRLPTPASSPRGAEERHGPRADRPTVSIIVPARNEERSLPGLLDSLRPQLPASGQLIVVDDASEDRTAALAAAGGARVLPAPPLPPGWLGKPWACWQGAAASTGQTLVFLDADTRLEPGGLGRILASHRRDGGLLSVWPYHRMHRPYERLSALFNVVVLASMGCFTILGRRLAPLGAFGPCLVCSREDYFAAGGHAAVRGAVMEDVGLGQAFQRSGRQLHNYAGRGSIGFRMYPSGLGALVDGFSKNFGSGVRDASPAVLLPLAGWIAGAFIAASWPVRAALAAGTASWPATLPWAVLYGLYALQMHWMLRRIGNYGAYTAALFPLPLSFFAFVFLLSLVRTHLLRRVRWKGRQIHVRRGSP